MFRFFKSCFSSDTSAAPATKETYPAPSTHVPNLLIGAGINGLYAALMLQKKGVNLHDMLIIDPRAGTYVRPGVMEADAINHYCKSLELPSVYSFEYYHIKDLERKLFRHAQDKAIPIEQKTFVGFTPTKGVIYEDEKGERAVLTADRVYDCTGSRRAVIHAANQRAGKPLFVEERCGNNPVKTNLIAYVRMDLDDASSLKGFEEEKPDPVQMKQLQTQFQWQRSDMPTLILHYFNRDKNKVCIYVEAPDGLPDNQKQAWLQAVMKLRSGGRDIDFQLLKPSRKYAKKPRFELFTVDTHRVMQAVCGNHPALPTIIPIGDSQIDIDYRLGVSSLLSMDRLGFLLDAMTIENGQVKTLDVITYTNKVTQQLVVWHDIINRLYSNRNILKITSKQHDMDVVYQRVSATEKVFIKQVLVDLEDNIPKMTNDTLADVSTLFLQRQVVVRVRIPTGSLALSSPYPNLSLLLLSQSNTQDDKDKNEDDRINFKF